VLLAATGAIGSARAQDAAPESGSAPAAGDSGAANRPVLQRRAKYFYPVPTSEQLTGFKLTLIAAYLWRTALDGTTRPSAAFTRLAYTANHQLFVGFGGDLWAPGNRTRINVAAAYSKFPAPFYGIGPRTSKAAEELFTPRAVALDVLVQRTLRAHLYAQVGAHFFHATLEERRPGGLLVADTIPGSAGYTNVEPEIGLVFDSRDRLFDPWHGELIEAHLRVNLPPLGGSTGYQLYLLDARAYRTVRPGSVLALQGAFAGASGTVPFEELPQLGGGTARAYVYGRWRDRAALWGQAEWRQHLAWRFGAIAFAGAGVIAPAIGSLASVPVRPSYGAGLRFNLSTKENANFSMDYARGQEGASAFSFGFAEAF
jgi:hypothetical protein